MDEEMEARNWLRRLLFRFRSQTVCPDCRLRQRQNTLLVDCRAR